MHRSLVTVALVASLGLPLIAAPVTVVPDIALTSDSGTSVRVTDFKGRVVLLDFWASWCVPCRKSFPEIDRLSREFANRGLQVIAVNVDEQRKKADAFLAQFPHTMTIAYDPKGVAAAAFDLQGMPSSLIVDRSGRVRFTHMGYTDKTIGQFRAEIVQLLAENHR